MRFPAQSQIIYMSILLNEVQAYIFQEEKVSAHPIFFRWQECRKLVADNNKRLARL
jgi:hypothetical protein